MYFLSYVIESTESVDFLFVRNYYLILSNVSNTCILDLWDELSVKWARSYWDDWMREPVQRKNRACIRPEISRTKTFGNLGVSNGLFFEKHLKFIVLNSKNISFMDKDLSYLLKDNYDKRYAMIRFQK